MQVYFIEKSTHYNTMTKNCSYSWHKYKSLFLFIDCQLKGKRENVKDRKSMTGDETGFIAIKQSEIVVVSPHSQQVLHHLLP